MAAEPFNSAGGYTVGIPPIQIIDETGNIIATDITASGNVSVTGNITATTFIGDLQGNITGSFQVTGPNTGVLFNDDGNVAATANLTFNKITDQVVVAGELVANSFTIGHNNTEFSTSEVLFATTNSAGVDQVLYTILANTISTIDYTVVATDATANTRQTSKLIAGILGDTADYYEYGTIDLNGGVGDFKVFNVDGNIQLTVTPLTSNEVQYKILITYIKEGL
jgi:hypothetical protein